MSTETITLPQACVKLRMTRDEVMRMIYRGELEAEQQPNGRWRVSAAGPARPALPPLPLPHTPGGAPTPACPDDGDDEPAPEPGDTQAEDRRRAVLEALREAPEANADSIASATGTPAFLYHWSR